jgi:hypothetical protein
VSNDKMIEEGGVHPYYVDKARAVIARAGGPDDTATAMPLARWAPRAALTRDPTIGVIVAEDGELVAETRHMTVNGAGAHYMTKSDARRLGIGERQAGMAMAEYTARTGRRVILVTVCEVTTGAGR